MQFKGSQVFGFPNILQFHQIFLQQSQDSEHFFWTASREAKNISVWSVDISLQKQELLGSTLLHRDTVLRFHNDSHHCLILLPLSVMLYSTLLHSLWREKCTQFPRLLSFSVNQQQQKQEKIAFQQTTNLNLLILMSGCLHIYL